MKTLLIGIFLLTSIYSYSQRWEHYQTSDSDGFLALPKQTPIGLIVRDYSQPIDTSATPRYKFGQLCRDAGFATFFTHTSQYYPDLYLNDTGPARLDSLIHLVLEAHPEISKDNLFIGGMSASGTRALKYTEYCGKGHSSFGHSVSGVFAVDPPLDLIRLYLAAQKIIGRNHPLGNRWESHLIVDTLSREMGALENNAKDYIDASVYCYSFEDSVQTAPYLRSAIRLYHEPDVAWWIDHRMESVYESNMADITGFFVALKGQGHTKVEIIHTQNKGLDYDGNPKPHSWTIVDEEDLVNWLRKQCLTP